MTEILEEYSDDNLGDRRLGRRLTALVRAASGSPDESFPRITGDEAGLEGAYRFLNNSSVTPERLLARHFERTRERARARGVVLAIHDTTQFTHPAEEPVKGLGAVPGGQGFFGHFTLLASANGAREPLGVAALRTWARSGPPKGERPGGTIAKDPNRESLRWPEQAVAVGRALPEVGVIHVMDREADGFELLSDMVEGQQRFIVRLKARRTRMAVDLESLGGREPLSDVVARASAIVTREVPLTKRKGSTAPKASRAHPPRGARMARLECSSRRVEFQPPPYASGRSPFAVSVVRVTEVEPPPEIEPVEWWLVTTEDASTPVGLTAVIDNYRARWLIEEYFKAIKSGCSFERRYLESYTGLCNALALFVPIAWRLLILRHLHRETPTAPATLVFSPAELTVLHALTRDSLRKGRGHRPIRTVRDALERVARLGGHITSNGDPGWIVLGRGFLDYIAAIEAVVLLSQRCDQS